MSQSTIKLATLNLWRFTDWEIRLPLIIDLIKKLDVDVLLLQEVQKNISKSEYNQVEILNQALRYPYAHFEIACVKTTRKGVPLPYPIDHGLGIISKIPFQTEVIPLTQEKDKETRILLKSNLKMSDISFSIINTHFTNTDSGAEMHLKETLNWLTTQNGNSIVAGDFNIKDLSQYKGFYEKSYQAASDIFPYVSYPEDNLSYDQILVSKEYSFIDFECREEIVSDHKLLYAEITLVILQKM